MIDVQTASKLRNRLTCVIVRSQVAQRQLDGQIGACVLTSLVEAEAAGWETLGIVERMEVEAGIRDRIEARKE